MKAVVQKFRKFKFLLYPFLGSFFVVAGWNWYHLNKHHHWRFIWISLLMWFGIVLIWFGFKYLFRFLTLRFHRHPFWQQEFYTFLDPLYLTVSLVFLTFFSKNELLTLGGAIVVFILLFFQSEYFLKKHPAAEHWVRVNRLFFFLGIFIFLFISILQYWSYYYYILDPSALIFNIVFFRAWSLTIFWLFWLALAGLCYHFLPRFWRLVPFVGWIIAFVVYLIFWAFNAGILYFSNLYLNPVIISHAEGGSGVMLNRISYELFFCFLAVLIGFLYLLRKFLQTQKLSPKRYWYYYNFLIVIIAIATLFSVASFWNTPEAIVIKSFYDYWRGTTEKVELNPVVQQKLEKFGLQYETSNFYVARREKVYNSDKKLLPNKFSIQKPNVVIVFWESLSSRLVGAYNSKRVGVTPALDLMATDPHTTIFKNYYNASTPTITGLISELCSILPPMGHNEIQNENRLQRHGMLCLPQILEDNGYKYSSYVTAVEKDFAHKDTIFTSMGTQEIYGTEELYKYIPGEPLSWGWSDHQLFPVTWKFMHEKVKEPFLIMLSTVDTHPPFTIAKDMVEYEHGDNEVINSFHTTDNAFGSFWEQFKNSEFYNDTILIVVADHAIFPAAFKNDKFPEEAGKLTFYDENAFLLYIPDNILPKTVETNASGIDFAPTLLQIFGINVPNNFEGHSIFDSREKFPNILGMHEFGLWINQMDGGKRKVDFIVPQDLKCENSAIGQDANFPLTMCEYENYYKWKRSMFEEGRFWFNKE